MAVATESKRQPAARGARRRQGRECGMTTQTQRLPITALPCVAVAATVGSLVRSFVRCTCSLAASSSLRRRCRCRCRLHRRLALDSRPLSHIGLGTLLRPQPAPTVRLGDVCLDFFFFFFGATSAIIKNSGIRMCARDRERGRGE